MGQRNPIVMKKPELVWGALVSSLEASRSGTPKLLARMLGQANGREGYEPSSTITWQELQGPSPEKVAQHLAPQRVTRAMAKKTALKQAHNQCQPCAASTVSGV